MTDTMPMHRIATIRTGVIDTSRTGVAKVQSRP